MSHVFLYQIIIDGVSGRTQYGNAALDDFSFQRGTCKQPGNVSHVIRASVTIKGKVYHWSVNYDHPGECIPEKDCS